jgi:hypothetical protein
MANAKIVHHWPDGGHVTLSVHADVEHPDALDHLVTRVLVMYREAVLDPDEADS